MSLVDEVANSPRAEPRTSEMLLELLSEEIPARMQSRAVDDLVRLLGDKLAAAEIPPAKMRGYTTPRRLVVIADGIPPTQPERSEERRGPRLGAPQPAIDGFLRSAGLPSLEECEIRDTGRGEFYFAVIKRFGRSSAEVLCDAISAAIAELPWPKSMRWPGASLRWVRPLTSILCIYDGAVVPLAIDGVPVGNTTRGHRFLSPGEFCADSVSEYLDKLTHAYVVVDPKRRRELISADLDRRAAELGVAVKPDPGLLDEVTGLAEFPVVLAGTIDPAFTTLPPEVLETAMRTHQRYFSCVSPDGWAAPYFLFVADNLPEDGGTAIVAGNERVLRARLADARFFWDQDRKVRLEDRVEALKTRVYHAKLGTVYDKVMRIERLAGFLAEQLYPTDEAGLPALTTRAARLAKADLATGMVGEFPELQGVIGRYYALADGEDPRVANAIADHYKPLGPSDQCPSELVSMVVALADKIDSLVAFFAIGETPTGSRDPFALRRAAQGVIRIILENRLRLPLVASFREADALRVQVETGRRMAAALHQPGLGFQLLAHALADPTNELLGFVADRLKVHLREEGVRHDLIAAAFTLVGQREDDLVRLMARVRALEDFLGSGDGASLLVAYRRAANIVRIEDRKDGVVRGSDVVPTRLREPEEATLAAALDAVGGRAAGALADEKFELAMAELARLRRPVDAFFDRVTVNTDDAILRDNRLRLLARIRDTMNRVADFSQIEG
jgi:glycyl-tRNA synthetase beta chain